MNKRKVNNYIGQALYTVRENEDYKNGVPKEFKGYISQLGASIIQSGLIPSVAFFENADKQANRERSYLLKVIFKMIDRNAFDKDNSFLEYLLNNKDREKYLREEVMNICIALKLALRSFPEDKSKNEKVN